MGAPGGVLSGFYRDAAGSNVWGRKAGEISCNRTVVPLQPEGPEEPGVDALTASLASLGKQPGRLQG